MTRSPNSLVPSASGQPETETRDDKAFSCRQEGEANLRAATEVNAVAASSYPPAIRPTQLELIPGRARPLEAKPVTDRNTARTNPIRRDGVEGGGTQRQRISTTGETLFGPGEATPTGREAYKDEIRKRRIDAEPGVGGGYSTDEARETERREGPLLPSCVQRRERQPECPREGRLNTGPVKPGAKRPLDSTMPANFRGRYTEWPSNRRKGGSRFSTIRSVGRTSCRRPGSG